ncbi:hypothetical protein F2P81_015572 [Scophthalmus maximus]|uniref:Uncharacterized protein n=1 Tax=Scophthalmus maximus TaxID=52904 RepID=A0A6A4ST51_SCOMX|nr:hypothetical protein F2P81_015572 [Scophthalmus maximus]
MIRHADAIWCDRIDQPPSMAPSRAPSKPSPLPLPANTHQPLRPRRRRDIVSPRLVLLREHIQPVEREHSMKILRITPELARSHSSLNAEEKTRRVLRGEGNTHRITQLIYTFTDLG